MFGEGSPLLNPWFTMRLQQGRYVTIIIPGRCTYRQIDGYIARVGGSSQKKKRYVFNMSWRASGSTVTTTSTISPSIAQKCSENPPKKINRSSFFTFWFREIRESCFCRWPTPPKKKGGQKPFDQASAGDSFSSTSCIIFWAAVRCTNSCDVTMVTHRKWGWVESQKNGDVGDGLSLGLLH